MRVRATVGLIAIACIAGLSGSATAGPAAALPVAGAGPTSRTAPEEVDIQKDPQALTKMETEATAVALGVKSLKDELLSKAMQARKDNDSVKYLCLSDKLNQLSKVKANIDAREASLTASANLVPPDLEKALHDYNMIREYDRHARKLEAEARTCIGSDLSFLGQDSVIATENPNVPPDVDLPDPYLGGSGGWFQPPVCVSCTQ